MPSIGEGDVISLTDITKDIVSEKNLLYKNSKISINVDIGNGVYTTQASSVELMRIMSNIINNSVESFDKTQDRKVDQPEIVIALRSYSDSVQMSISDNGIGISPEILEKLGQEGFSYGKLGSSEAGSGLGIFHAKSYIAKIGGTFRIQSKVGLGTMITITLKKYLAA